MLLLQCPLLEEVAWADCRLSTGWGCHIPPQFVCLLLNCCMNHMMQMQQIGQLNLFSGICCEQAICVKLMAWTVGSSKFTFE